ncbi:MAG: RdgB/HAM1 family non-canonical purine NTP pyrophosphatase [Clostridia bacterium]|nr:RdgB/HAM1 family non-canonical purine NTP pyrophosphatase [Clostridia bacterium]
MMKFFIATKNNGKIRELSRIFCELGIDVVSERDLKEPMPEVEEDGETFEDNALIKARAGAKFTELPTVADDSGLCVDALGGAPGILSARYSGEHGNDKANNEKLLKELSGVTASERTAHYICAIACVFPDGREFTVSGRCDGSIDFKESGAGGFGYDPLFIGEVGKFSEVSAETKDAVSHRGKAVKLFKERINDYL